MRQQLFNPAVHVHRQPRQHIFQVSIGYRPLDSSDVFRPAVEARQQSIDTLDPVAIYQGGAFVKATPHG